MPNQMALDLSLRSEPTLDNFIIGKNAELVQVLREMLAKPGERLLYLWGGPGSGRSHLLKAMVEGFRQQHLSASYIPCDAAAEFAPGLDQLDMIAVDDAERLSAPAQIGLFNLYNHVREGQAVLLVSGTLPPAQLKLRADLITRLGWGLVLQVHALNDEEKTQALQRHAGARGLTLPRDVADYLLRHGRRDMSSLLALLEALDNYSLQAKRPVTLPLLREFLQSSLLQGGQ
ncbi:MAG: DnaA regulatory inactivator Hda [Burkholderiales bacterium]